MRECLVRDKARLAAYEIKQFLVAWARKHGPEDTARLRAEIAAEWRQVNR
jgi:hypothetical protein